MAQAMPRYCPRCGSPTKANMSYCATCELPVEAMFKRPTLNESDKTLAAPYEAMQEPAAAPTPRALQQEDQFQPNAAGSVQRDFVPTWNPPAEAPQPASFPSVSSVPPDNWDALDTMSMGPDVADWPTQTGAEFAPRPEGLPTFNNTSPNPGIQAGWTPQADPWQAPASPLPMQPTYNSASQAASWQSSAPPLPAQPDHSLVPQPKSKRRVGILLVLLVVLLVLGGGGYLAVSMLGVHVPGLNMGQATIKTSQVHTTITYAGMNVTLVSVQQSQNFSDDPQSASDGMVRLNLQEQNTTTVPISWNYTASARLVGAGKSPLAPTYVKSKTSIAPGATQTSVVDFAVPNGGNLSKMFFQLGTDHEAQMQIPLAGQANLSQYQPRTTKQNGTAVYFGLNWTLTGAITSLSIPGQQASNGMEYVTLNLSVDNTLSQMAISGSPFDYLNVKVGNQTEKLVATTLPVSFATGATGKTGTATFLIPQKSSACTLQFVSQDPGGKTEASIDFKL